MREKMYALVCQYVYLFVCLFVYLSFSPLVILAYCYYFISCQNLKHSRNQLSTRPVTNKISKLHTCEKY